MKTREIKRILAFILVTAMLFSLNIPIVRADGEEPDVPGVMRDITGTDFVAEMGVGWNLGNSLESGGYDYGSDRNLLGLDELSWGSPYTTKAMIDAIADAGFKTLRIPITWESKIGPAPNYEITDVWMNRVEEVVNYGLDNDLTVIINIHHDSWVKLSQTGADGNQTGAALDATEKAAVKDKYEKVWTQIANRFKNYGDKLVFESLNEPREYGYSNQWGGGTSQGRSLLNEYNQWMVDVVRATGGNNETRFILTPTYAASADATQLNDYQRPSDPMDLSYTYKRIILSVHAYVPNDFALNAPPGKSVWDSAVQSAIDSSISRAQNRANALGGMPIIMGEFGAVNRDNLAAREIYSQYYVAKAKAAGIACIWWDGYNMAPNTAESFGLLSRGENPPSIAFPGIVTAMLNGLTGDTGLTSGSGVKIAPAQKTLRLGLTATFTPKAYVFPLNGSQTVTWSTNNPSVATVNASSGLITAVGAGTATITATSGTETADCVVTVKPDTTTRYNRLYDFETDGLDGVTQGDTDDTTNSYSVVTLGDSQVLKISDIKKTDNSTGLLGWTNLSINFPSENAGLIRRSQYITYDLMIKVSDTGVGFEHVGLVLKSGVSFPGDDGWKGWWDQYDFQKDPNNMEIVNINGEDYYKTTVQVDVSRHVPYISTSTSLGMCFLLQGFYSTASVYIDNIWFTYQSEIPESAEIPATDVAVTSITSPLAPNSTIYVALNGGQISLPDLISPVFVPADATNKNLMWTSGNTGRMTVTPLSGILTKVDTGTNNVTITATSVNGGKTATLSVGVARQINSVTIDKSTATIKAGETDVLAATVNTASSGQGTVRTNVIWKSSDTNVATVDANGTVTAVGGGVATITAYAAADFRRFASCEVTVTETVEMTVISPTQYQKVSRFLDIEASVIIDGTDTVDNVSAVIDGKTIALDYDSVSETYKINADFMTMSITNKKVIDMDVVLTTTRGKIITESYKIPYILSGSMLTVFSDPAQIAYWENGGSWDAGLAGLSYEEVPINGVSTGLLRCDFVASAPTSGWQEIKPIFWFEDYDLAGVQNISFDIYVPYYSTTGGTNNTATNQQNSTWNLNGKLVLDGGSSGYLEITNSGFVSQALSNNTNTITVQGPDKAGTGTTNWRKRTVTVDVSAYNLNNSANITLGLVLGQGGSGSNARPTFNTPIYIGNVQFTSNEFTPRTQIYDYFDGYLGDTGWFNHLNPVENAETEINPAYVQFGTNGLSLSVEEGGGSVAINSRAPNNGSSLNWNSTSAHTNFYFWVKPDGTHGQSITVDITSGGNTYTATVALREVTEYYRVNIPFSSFTGTSGNLGTAANRASVSQVKFTLNQGSAWLDRIYAHKDVEDPDNNQTPLDTANFTNKGGKPFDSDITPEAASLFGYLRNVMYDPNKVLFGQQQSTANGLTITATDGYQSDIKAGVNDQPAVLGFDSATFGWTEYSAGEEARRALIAAKELGSIITLASHIGNPYVDGGAYNTINAASFNSTDGVMVPGSVANQRLVAHFEKVAEFLLILQEYDVPVIYRPWHEVVLSGSFFWWHSATAQQYKDLWVWTIEFLQARGIHNVLYSYSPNTTTVANITTLYTEGPNSFYPGDEYVDVFGYDTYANSFTGANELVRVLGTLYEMAHARDKILALTETGANTSGSGPNATYFTRLLNDLMGAANNSRFVAYVLTWVNYGDTNYYVPWPEYGNTAEHGSFANFVTFYNDPRTVFASETGGYSAITNMPYCMHMGDTYDEITLDPTYKTKGLKNVICANCDEVLETDVEADMLRVKPAANFEAAAADNESITFTWTNPNPAGAVEYYEIYTTNGGNKWLVEAAAVVPKDESSEAVYSVTLAYSELGITKSGSYDFRIRAYACEENNSAYTYVFGPNPDSPTRQKITIELTVPTVKPKPITDFNAVVNSESITFTWINPNADSRAVEYYELYMTSGGSAWLATPVVINAGDVTVDEGITSVELTFEFLGITKSGSYDFRIKACNVIGAASYVYLGGENRYKAAVEVTSLIPTAKPKAVTAFNAVSDGVSVTLSWVNPNNSASAVAYYELYRTNTGNTWQTPVTINPTDVTVSEGVSSVTFTLEELGIIKNGSYDFRIKAANLVGVSALTYLGGGTSADVNRYRLDVVIGELPEEPDEPEPAFTTLATVKVYTPKNSLASVTLPEPTNGSLPLWRGFNKLNLYSLGEGSGYDDNGTDIRETDFVLMSDLGFNFIRFPMDYRFFYNKDGKTFDMEKIHWIDNAIEYGIKYNIHIELNLHYAPGYRVANGQGLNTLLAEQEHFIEIWKFFAKRYKNIPNTVLDFNLLNEPGADDFIWWDGYTLTPEYAVLLADTINAIRAERPDRLIVLDADHRNPYNLSSLGISLDNIYQSQHGYGPFSLTHRTLGANMPQNFTNVQLTWPINNYFNGYLYANWKSTRFFGVDNAKAVFNNPNGFDDGAVNVEVVSQSSNNVLTLVADGVIKGTASVPSGSGIRNVSFAAGLIEGAQKVEIYISAGDWVIVNSYQLGDVFVDCTNADWGYPPSEMTVGVDTVTGPDTISGWYLNDKWTNIPKMFGEIGCIITHGDYEQLAYRAALMQDYADAFVDYPWAYWEFKGGNMSMFRLYSSGAHTAPYTVTDSKGTSLTYYVDALWYNSIKHVLANSYDGFTSPEPPTPPEPPVTNEPPAILLDGFESYADTDALKSAWSVPSGFPGEVSLSLESGTANVNTGDNAAALALDGSTDPFSWWIAQTETAIPLNIDWTDRSGISLWMKSTVAGVRLVAVISDTDGNTFVIPDNIINITTAGGAVHILFKDLVPESGTAQPDPSKFNKLTLRVALPGMNFVGTIYIDDVFVGYTETLVPPTPKPPKAPKFVIEDFEGYTDSIDLNSAWWGDDTAGATTYELSLETGTANVHDGDNAMAFAFNTVDNPWWTMMVDTNLPASLDWEEHDNLSFWLKATLPSSSPKLDYTVSLFYADDSEYYSSVRGAISSSGGVVNIPLNSIANSAGDAPDFSQIVRISLRFPLNWPPSLEGTVYIDDICLD